MPTTCFSCESAAGDQGVETEGCETRFHVLLSSLRQEHDREVATLQRQLAAVNSGHIVPLRISAPEETRVVETESRLLEEMQASASRPVLRAPSASDCDDVVAAKSSGRLVSPIEDVPSPSADDAQTPVATSLVHRLSTISHVPIQQLHEAWVTEYPRKASRDFKNSLIRMSAMSRLSTVSPALAAMSWQPVLSPTSQFYVVFEITGISLLLFDLIDLPLVAFHQTWSELDMNVQLVTTILWTLMTMVFSLTNYIDEDGSLETTAKGALLRYFRTWMCFDLALLSIDWFIIFSDLGFLRFARALRILGLRRVLRSSIWRVQSSAGFTLIVAVRFLLVVLLSIHMVACGWYGASNFRELQPDKEYDTTATFLRYMGAFRWSIAQLGIGLGHTHQEVQTIMENLYAIGVNIVCFALISGLVAGNYTGMLWGDSTQRRQLEELRTYLSRHKVSTGLRSKIWSIMDEKHSRDKYMPERNVELLQVIPLKLMIELRCEVFIPILTVHHFFAAYAMSQVSHRALHEFVGSGGVDDLSLDNRDEVFGEGHVAQGMYVVVQGSLKYVLGEQSRNLSEIAEKDMSFMHSLDSESGGDSQFVNEVADVLLLRPGSWLSEPALWLRWTHKGCATAKANCNLVFVRSDPFRKVMNDYLPEEARRYAIGFLGFMNRKHGKLSDDIGNQSTLQALAQDIFAISSHVFKIENCHPVSNRFRNEWEVFSESEWQRLWRTAWKEAHLTNKPALLAAMTTDLKRDVILFYQTLFSNNIPRIRGRTTDLAISPEDLQLMDQKVVFLKRLVLCLAWCGLYSCCEDNGDDLRFWTFPLASALCHGGRILICLEGVSCQQLMNALILGVDADWSWEEKGPPQCIYVRRTATHALRIGRKMEVHERRGKMLASVFGNHLGMDIPVGGFGNSAPCIGEEKLFIGPAGVPYRIEKDNRYSPVFLNQAQHGHLYMFWEDFSRKVNSNSAEEDENSSVAGEEPMEAGVERSSTSSLRHPSGALLIGIEASAPQKMSLFGDWHGVHARSKGQSAFGKRKWRDYRACGEVPASLGGMRVNINSGTFTSLQRLLSLVKLSLPSQPRRNEKEEKEEKELFQQLLQATGPEARDLLEARFKIL